MRILCLTLLAVACARGQSNSGAWWVKNTVGRIGVNPTLRTDPPSSPLAYRFSETSRGRSITNGPTFFSRILIDKTNRVYFGYEFLLEAQPQQGAYLATFGKLGATALDLAAGSIPDASWAILALPSIPEPRIVHDGETISIELYLSPSGEKLIDDIRINPPATPRTPPSVPTVSGSARDFSITDAEIVLTDPRVTVNGRRQITPPIDRIRGPLVWLYLPEHGRYVLSLVARPDFKQAGEIRGGVIAFTLGGDSVKLECPTPIATGDAAYHLYVMRDAQWAPAMDRQKDRPMLGTVSPAELAALKQQ
jgi:hypothetical protein